MSHKTDEQLGSGTDCIERTLKGTAEQLSREEEQGGEQTHCHQNSTEVHHSSKWLLATALADNHEPLAREYAERILSETDGKQLIERTLSQFSSEHSENDASRAVRAMLAAL